MNKDLKSPSWQGDELPSIAYLLEKMDLEMGEIQRIQIEAAGLCEKTGYFLLAATLQELAADTIKQRIKMIDWGIHFGLTGINTEEVLDELVGSCHQLPSIYHDDIRAQAEKAREDIRQRRHPA
jgi:hypothetical protein